MISIIKAHDIFRHRERHFVKINGVIFHDWRLIPGYYLMRVRGMLNRHFAEKHAALGGCSNCGSFHRVDWRPSLTAYAWDPKSGKPDPNAPVWLCDDCGEDYAEYWETMWSEHYASQGY